MMGLGPKWTGIEGSPQLMPGDAFKAAVGHLERIVDLFNKYRYLSKATVIEGEKKKRCRDTSSTQVNEAMNTTQPPINLKLRRE